MRRVRNTKIRLFPTLPPSESPSAPPFPTLRAPSAARHAVRLFPAPVPTLPRYAVRPTAAQAARGHACGPALSVASSAEETPQRGPFTPNCAEKPLQRGFIMFRGGTHGTPRRGGLLRRTGAAVTSRGAYTLPPRQPPAARQTNTPDRRTRRRQSPDRASHEPIHPPTH